MPKRISCVMSIKRTMTFTYVNDIFANTEELDSDVPL